MADFLLELLSEEIPARMQRKAREDLERLFKAELDGAGLTAESIETFSTPRRLALIARGLPQETEAVREERKGPKADAPDQAIDGFLRSTGLARGDLETRDVKGKSTLFAVIDKPGRATKDVLGEAIPAIIRAFPWPKSMRWGAASISTESLRWVRPLQGIVAILGEDLVECEIDGIASGYETVGHRFHHSGALAAEVGTGSASDNATNKNAVITIGGADDYAEKLRACHVIVDHKEREGIIRARANALAEEAGLTRKQDPGLVEENAGLTEWPAPLLGAFDEAFLAVAPEAITLAMRSHQKYFACLKPDGSLSPHFICVANIEAADDGAHVVAGNEKVLAARLSDAKFFWEQDQKVSLAEHAKKLDQIVFHEKLGTLADKVDRVAKLARWLVEEGIVPPSPLVGEGRGEGREAGTASPIKVSSGADAPGPSPNPLPQGERAILADKAEQAARLAKADLVTGMVGEFADLQGIMGGYYAANEGLDDEVAAAIRDHYKPVGQGDEVPTAPVTVAVSLADKIDTITGFFGINEKPTGSKDPFAIRRAGLGVISLILTNGLRCSMQALLGQALMQHGRFWWSRLVGKAQEVDSLITGRMQGFLDLAARASVRPTKYEGTSIEDVLNERLRDEEDVEKAVFVFADMKQLEIVPFFGERLSVQQRDEGVRHDVITSVFSQGGETDLVRLLARVKALQAFLKTADGANLLAGYKRAANILKKEGWDGVPSRLVGEGQGEGRDAETALPTKSHSGADAPDPSPQSSPTRGEEVGLSYSPEPEEALLREALERAEPEAEAAIEREDFEGAMAALATLRKPIDAFFDKVTVNDEDPVKRAARLQMLERMRDAVHRVADFSRIEGGG
ncbi:glycine--tRNA ligase subunit beta [Parasphingopyxis algicola]|uniref:glycine--tRNA ligase subunit beta n=1 Tax=Parasphingopyxis algicola TaxID=2026624 RepID=UPI0015A16166|nr:glycine--tRNA ligase subunit beta [Parasphingopyxis algicola]QLC24513.1 glycine--tRNA ligase subunit beta [Parasphingopyxis algicola]